MKPRFLKLMITAVLIVLMPVYTYASEVPAQAPENAVSPIYVTLNDNGNSSLKTTTAATVGQFLADYRVKVEPYDLLSNDYGDALYNGMCVTIERGYAVCFYVHYQTYTDKNTVYVSPGKRFYQVIADYSDAMGEEYAFDEALWNVAVNPGMSFDVYNVTTVRVSTNEEAPYGIEYYYTDKLPNWYQATVACGEAGTVFVVEEIRYEANEEVSRTRIFEEITQAPVNELVAVGTGAPELPVPEDLTEIFGGARAANRAENVDLYQDLYQNGGTCIFIPDDTPLSVLVATDNAGGSAVAQLPVLTSAPDTGFAVVGEYIYVDGVAYAFTQGIAMSATAYTADYASTHKRAGDKYFGITASGLKAQVGVVAVDPNVIPLFTKLYIEGYGFAIAGDTGKSVKGNIVDLFFNTSGEVKTFGRQKRNVYILTNQDFEIALQK